jgi:hypothetical protein
LKKTKMMNLLKQNSILLVLFSFMFLNGSVVFASEQTKETLNVNNNVAESTIPENVTLYPNPMEEDFEISSEESAQRKWEHAMPFMAQDVIDMGFELPFPYGVAVIYAKVRQDLTLKNLEIGANNNGLTPIEFVSFSDAQALNDTVQIKADMWLFPFMNVYAVVGAITGDADLDFTIDGNGLIEQSGIDCSKIINRPICKKLQDNNLRVSLGNGTGDINGEGPEYSGYNVGIGTILAAGYKDWFIALPITYVYSYIDILDSTVETLNFAPRVGKTMDLSNDGSLSIFVGAGYLDVDMDLTGVINVNSGDLDTIEYKIHQENTDKWNALAGFNWDVTKHWSFNLEAGFWGSRENIIAGMTYRY